MVVDMLNAAPGINCHKPEGAFYVFPSVHGCIGKTTQGRQAGSTTTRLRAPRCWRRRASPPCTARRSCYPGHFRISYATDTESLREACTRIQRFCQSARTDAGVMPASRATAEPHAVAPPC